MKKILIISHPFPPLNLISSRRAEAYARYFSRFGYQPTVITELREERKVKGKPTWRWHEPGDMVRKEMHEGFTAYYIPRIKTRTQKRIDFLLRIPVLKGLFRSWLVYAGHPHGDYYYCYQQFKTFIWRHLARHRYDCVLASYKPDYPLMLAYEIKKHFGIPYVADYRDHFDNRMINIKQAFGFRDRFIQYFSRRNHRRWANAALFFVIVNRPLCELMIRHTGMKDGHVVPNGFEQSTFALDNTEISKENFFITYTGNVYAENDFSFFYKGFNQFVESLDEEDRQKVKLRIYTHPSADLSEQKRNIPERYLLIPGWVPKEEVIVRLRESCVLLTLGFTNQPGTVPGKVFEYLGSGRNILVTPSDGHEVKKIIEETKTGLSTSDPDEVDTWLQSKFREWKKTGKPSYCGVQHEINKYSRETQVEKVARLIDERLDALSTNEQSPS